MSGNDLAGVVVAIIFVVIPFVSWVIKKFKRDNDISGHREVRMCGNCKKVIQKSCTVGDICPHCGTKFESFVVIGPK